MSYSEQTYGEIIDIQKLYSIIKTHIPDTCKYYFYDFGSGFGKIVENIGSEINKERHEKAERNKRNPNSNYIYGNFFHTFVEHPSVVICNNLCLGNGTLKRLSMKFNKELNSGDLLLVTKPLPLVKNQPDYLYSIDCSWGESEIYLYKM